jgi:hypothetical protein
MSLLRRIKRYFTTQHRRELATVDRIGIGGEQYAGQFLTPPLVVGLIANPVLPHPSRPHLFLESDFLVYAAGTLFCLEIKNYKGIISYANREQTEIAQQKIGRYGEDIPAKFHQNPLRQAKGFLFHLKRYLEAKVDPRFGGLYIVPAAAFVRNGDTDISAIWNPAAGILYVDELPAFIEANANRRFAARPSRWIIDGLQRVPRPDVIVTLAGDPLRGFLTHTHLALKIAEGQPVMIPFSEILEVRLSRSGRFSDCDTVLVILRNGKQESYTSLGGAIQFRTLHGMVTTRHLHNLISIFPGHPITVRAH